MTLMRRRIDLTDLLSAAEEIEQVGVEPPNLGGVLSPVILQHLPRGIEFQPHIELLKSFFLNLVGYLMGLGGCVDCRCHSCRTYHVHRIRPALFKDVEGVPAPSEQLAHELA
jgi:hypothetical protein